MNAVWKHSISDGRARLVLLAIADHQGEMGAWPSIAKLAQMVNASPRSVKRDIQYLQEIKELKVELQNAPTGGQYKTNRYWVTLPGVTDVTPLSAQSGVTNAHSGVTKSASGVTAGGTQTLNRTLNKKHIQEMFDEFWNAYPQKKDKARAFKSFQKALGRAKFEEILAGVIAYRNDPKRNPDYTKFPATWLNNDCWEDAGTHSVENNVRREKELEYSKRLLEEQEKARQESVSAPLCEHGKNIVLCLTCLEK